jgi:hypothetical protein
MPDHDHVHTSPGSEQSQQRHAGSNAHVTRRNRMASGSKKKPLKEKAAQRKSRSKTKRPVARAPGLLVQVKL